MPVIQPVLSMSEAAEAGLNLGNLFISGGVVRETATGKIFEHLKDETTKNPVSSIESALETAKTASVAKASTSVVVKETTSLSLGRKFAVGTLIVVGVAAIGYGSYRLYTYLKKRSDEKKQEELIAYNPELTEYFNNMQTQSMSLSSIKKVVYFFDHYSNGDLSIEITDQELLVIRNLIVRYTIKLCESNNISIDNKQLFIEAKATVKSELVQDIVYATKIQEVIFSKE